MTDRDIRFSNDPIATTDTGVAIETPSIVVPFQKAQNRVAKDSPHHHIHFFDAYSENPPAVTFQTQDDDERILLFLRKSQVLNLPWILFTLLMAVVPFIFFMVKNYLFPFPIPIPLLFISIAFYYLLTVTYAYINFIIWYFNAALITNKRIIDIDFHQLVYKDVAETKLSLVQDVSYRQASVISNLFDHGNVLIQTAGTIDNFEFHSLPKPEKIVQIVENLIGKGRIYAP